MKKKDSQKTKKKEKGDVSVSRQSIFGSFLIFILISGIMFSLGVLVGRGTAPVTFNIDELEKDIKNLKKTFSITDDNKTVNKLSDKPELEFYDALKNGKEDHRLIVKKITPSQVPIPKKEYAQKTENSKPPVNIKEKKEIKKTASQSKPKKMNPEPKPAGEKKGRYTIQVAAFKKIEDADKLVNNLSLKGYHSYRSIGKTKDSGIWYRVRVGAFGKREDAQKTLGKLNKDKIKGIIINK